MHRQSKGGLPSTTSCVKIFDLASARSSYFTDLVRMKRDNTGKDEIYLGRHEG